LTQVALKGFLAQKCKNEQGVENCPELDNDIKAGDEAAQKVCKYVDWLLSTVNPNVRDEGTWIRPECHACQKMYKDLQDGNMHDDYCDLLNLVQRHTRCSTNYCLKKKGDSNSEVKCRFNFPIDLCPKTTLEFEEVHTKDNEVHYRAKIVTKRNDSRLNNNQRLQLRDGEPIVIFKL
jgi:hypothetical protein